MINFNSFRSSVRKAVPKPSISERIFRFYPPSFKTSVLYYNRTNVLMSNIDDTPMADAIYDRPLHHAYKTDMRSDSMRIIKRPLVKTDKKEVIERENKLS